MTTKEINAKIEKLTIEINKVKSYATQLSKILIENDLEVPKPNWQTKAKEENNEN